MAITPRYATLPGSLFTANIADHRLLNSHGWTLYTVIITRQPVGLNFPKHADPIPKNRRVSPSVQGLVIPRRARLSSTLTRPTPPLTVCRPNSSTQKSQGRQYGAAGWLDVLTMPVL
jgi:hypothetical protein